MLIPVVKALEAELGKERAHELVRGAIAENYAGFVASRTETRNTHPSEGSGAGGPSLPAAAPRSGLTSRASMG